MPDAPDAVIAKLTTAFANCFDSSSPELVAFAPGRVNLIGDHTDYNNGFVLPMTVDSGVYIAVRRRTDRQVRLNSLNFRDEFSLSLDEPCSRAPGHWTSYLVGVSAELASRFDSLSGYDAVIFGDLPHGAGLSSSAALCTATSTALSAMFDLPLEPEETARLCQQVEHKYAGVACGIMDQFASLLGRHDHALFLDCRSLEYEHVKIPFSDCRIVIVASGVQRQLVDSKYNQRRSECNQATSHLKKLFAETDSLRDVSREVIHKTFEELPNIPARRCRHVVNENHAVKIVVDAFRCGDLHTVGKQMNESHHSLKNDFDVSCEELDSLVEIAQNINGVYGARMTGGGFGGCTVNLVAPDAVERFIDRVKPEYSARHGLEAKVIVINENRESGVLARMA